MGGLGECECKIDILGLISAALSGLGVFLLWKRNTGSFSKQQQVIKPIFYDNCRNSCALIGSMIYNVNKRTVVNE